MPLGVQQQPPPVHNAPSGSGAAAVAAVQAARGMGPAPSVGGVGSPELVMPQKRFTLGGGKPGGGGGNAGSPRRSQPPNPRVMPPAAYGSPPPECWGSPGKDKPSGPADGFPSALGAGAPPPLPPSAVAGGGPMLTGQPEVDKEIMAFYQARDSLVKQRMANGAPTGR